MSKPGGTPRESKKARRARALEIARRLEQGYPDVTCALAHTDAFQLLAATVLSAQTTDKKVNEVTPVLFGRWPTPEAMAEASDEALQDVVHSLGFFRQKAKSLKSLSTQLRDEFGGTVPRTLEELTRLRGVARKTANVVMGTAFGIASGVVVDTHVKRIAGKRLRLTKETDPTKVERDLMELLPKEEWIDFSHRLIWHGRRVCDARRPACEDCNMPDVCPSAFEV